MSTPVSNPRSILNSPIDYRYDRPINLSRLHMLQPTADNPKPNTVVYEVQSLPFAQQQPGGTVLPVWARGLWPWTGSPGSK